MDLYSLACDCPFQVSVSYRNWFRLGESVVFCPWKENKHAQKTIPMLISVCSFQMCLHVLAIVWNLFWFRSMPKCELGSHWEIFICMRYQERFSRVWSLNFYKSNVCFPSRVKQKKIELSLHIQGLDWLNLISECLISHLATFCGEEGEAEWESWLYALKSTHTIQFIYLESSSFILTASAKYEPFQNGRYGWITKLLTF